MGVSCNSLPPGFPLKALWLPAQGRDGCGHANSLDALGYARQPSPTSQSLMVMARGWGWGSSREGLNRSVLGHQARCAENPPEDAVGGRTSHELNFPTPSTSSIVPSDSAYKHKFRHQNYQGFQDTTGRHSIPNTGPGLTPSLHPCSEF